MGKMSREKGKRGEREFVKFCREHGFECRRAQQYAGGIESADVVGLPGLHVEVKAWNTITTENIRDFLRQAFRDRADSRKIPIVAHKEDYRKWYISMETADFVNMFMDALNDPISYPLNTTYNLTYITMPADDWMEIYREYAAGLKVV